MKGQLCLCAIEIAFCISTSSLNSTWIEESLNFTQNSYNLSAKFDRIEEDVPLTTYDSIVRAISAADHCWTDLLTYQHLIVIEAHSLSSGHFLSHLSFCLHCKFFCCGSNIKKLCSILSSTLAVVLTMDCGVLLIVVVWLVVKYNTVCCSFCYL